MRLARPHKLLTHQYELELESNQWLKREEIQQIAWQKLKKLLDHAYENVPFYRQRFDKIGLMPQDIRTEADFCQIPLLTKDDIRENSELLIAKNFNKNKMQRQVTSGSTGVPFVTYYDHHFMAANVAAFSRSRRWFGWEFGDKVAWLWLRYEDCPQNFKEKMISFVKRERWMDGMRPTQQKMQDFAKIWVRWKPDLVAGMGNVIHLFAMYLDNQNITDIRPKFVETTGMKLWPHERELIERVFQCPVSDRYGSFESGSVVAIECPQGSRHVFQDFCHVEILRNGKPAPYGEPGEVVTTPLYAFGMPIIRFRLDDVAVWDDKICPCGRGLPLMRDIVGRVTSIFTLPSGRFLYGGAFRHLVLKDSTNIKRFRVHQYSKDKIEISLEKAAGFDDSLVDLVHARCLELLAGEPVELTIQVVDELPTAVSGKLLVTTSDVPVRLN